MKQMLAIGLLCVAAANPLLPASSGHAVNVSIRPESVLNNPYELLAHERTTYVCTVDIEDLTTKNVMTGPKVVLDSGEKRERTKNVNGYEITYSVSISANASEATWDVVMKDGPRILTKQHSVAMLRAPSNRR